VSNLLRQISGSLDEAHRQGIVHRDLKPENVILIERAGEKDVVKLVDFGIAARTESADRAKEQKLTQQGMVLGTPPYMSPEQFTGKALDARSDVYSLGIMTYEMLTGQLPFQADTPWQWATHHMTSQPRSFDEIPAGRGLPEAVRRTVLKSLAKEPGDRQSGAVQFHAEFLSALSATGSVAPRPATAAVSAGGRTEAMPEVPLGIAATQAMPEASPLSPGRAAAPTPPGVVAVPPAPSRDAAGRGGKGMIYGLGGVAGVLGVVLVALLWKPNSSSDGPPLDLQPTAEQPGNKSPTASTGSAPEPATIEPDPIPASPEPSRPSEPAAPDKPPSSGKTASTTRPAGSKTPAPSPAATPPTTAPKPSTTPSPTASVPQLPPGTQIPPGALPPGVQLPPGVSTPAATPAPSGPAAPASGGAAACAACIQAARGNAILQAEVAYQQCSVETSKAACRSQVSRTASKEVVRLSRLGRCVEGKAIMTAALKMGVTEDKLAGGRSACP
jgi:serine/threonine-protein kinase